MRKIEPASTLVDALHKSLEPEVKRADAAMAAAPAKLTRKQREWLRQKAAFARATAKESAKIMTDSAKFYEKLAKAGKLTSANRRDLRHRLAITGTLKFAALGGVP